MIGLSLSARLLLDGCHAVSAASWLPRQWRCAWVDRLPAWLDRWRTRSRAHSAGSRVRGWMRFPRGSVLFPCDLLHASVAARVTGCAWPGSSSRLRVLGNECDYCTSIVISNSRALTCIYVIENSLGGSGPANAHVALSLSSAATAAAVVAGSVALGQRKVIVFRGRMA